VRVLQKNQPITYTKNVVSEIYKLFKTSAFIKLKTSGSLYVYEGCRVPAVCVPNWKIPEDYMYNDD